MKASIHNFSLRSLLLGLAMAVTATAVPAAEKLERPNILWITIEDWSPDLSCYGTKGIDTPNVDKLASEGIRYEAALPLSRNGNPSPIPRS